MESILDHAQILGCKFTVSGFNIGFVSCLIRNLLRKYKGGKKERDGIV